MSKEYGKQRYWNKWHDCEDRQPDKYGLYLTVDYLGFYEVLIWDNEWKPYQNIANEIDQHAIIAWQPFEEFKEG